MKLRIFAVAMIIAALLVPTQVSGKEKPDRTVLLSDANGAKIGRVIGMETASWPYVLTDRGYRTLFRVGTGMLYNEATIFFESTNCTGDAYVGVRSIGTVFLATSQDTLAYAMGALFYSPNDAQGATINTNSTLDTNLNCIPFVSTREAYPAYANDPDITGIKNTVYPTRMVIE